MEQKKKPASLYTVRIRIDQYDALLKIAAVQQQQRCVPVTVGMLVRELIDRELKK